MMLRTLNTQNSVPAVGRLHDIAETEIGKWQRRPIGLQSWRILDDGHHGRQGLWRPKDRLLVKGPLRVMSESRDPISSGIQKSQSRLWTAPPGRHFDNWDF